MNVNAKRFAAVAGAVVVLAGGGLAGSAVAGASAPHGTHTTPGWATVYPASNAIKKELHIKGQAFILVTPRESLVIAQDGRYWPS